MKNVTVSLSSINHLVLTWSLKWRLWMKQAWLVKYWPRCTPFSFLLLFEPFFCTALPEQKYIFKIENSRMEEKEPKEKGAESSNKAKMHQRQGRRKYRQYAMLIEKQNTQCLLMSLIVNVHYCHVVGHLFWQDAVFLPLPLPLPSPPLPSARSTTVCLVSTNNLSLQ